MLFIVVLLILLASVNVQGSQYTLPPWMRGQVYEKLFRNFNPNQQWSSALANAALFEAMWPRFPRDTETFIRLAKKMFFPKTDSSELAVKVRAALESALRERATWPSHSDNGVHYGCGGVYNTDGEMDFVSVVCFFQLYG
ncbi:hypothetical protein OSTOST_09991 [Ostertagia ostertagi]